MGKERSKRNMITKKEESEKRKRHLNQKQNISSRKRSKKKNLGSIMFNILYIGLLHSRERRKALARTKKKKTQNVREIMR